MQKVDEYYRYCPDQPKVLISDSICLARRKARYPQCPGCQFNDDEKAAEKKAADPRRHGPPEGPDPLEQVFVGYHVLARFPDPLSEEVAWRIGHAAASYLRSALRGLDRSNATATTMVVGRDSRSSSDTLTNAAIEGVRSTGANVVNIGLVDSPQMYFAVNKLGACGGLYTTGSHAPADINGFKIVGKMGKPVGPDTGLLDISRIAQNMVRHDTGLQGEIRDLDLADEYGGFVRGHLRPIRPLRLAIDASNGLAARWVPTVFAGVADLELSVINAEPQGQFTHPPDPSVDANLDQLRESVRESGADLGICFDGDAGRITLIDEQAEPVRNDLLTALLARSILQRSSGSTIVYDLRSSQVVAEEIRAAGGVPRRERVGQSFMKKAMSESKAAFGGELSGRFYFYDNACCDSALLAIVCVLKLLTEEGRTLSELVRPLRRYAHSGQRFFAVDNPDAIVRRLASAYSAQRVDYLDGITVRHNDWWFNVRRSVTSDAPAVGLVIEATTPELLDEKLTEVTAHLGEPTPAPA